MFDARWGDDARDRDGGSRELSRGGRGGSDPRARERERVEPRDVFARHVNLPSGREREHVWVRDHYHMLRGSESRTLASVGAFRVIRTDDLRDAHDKPLDPRHGELWHLREAGLAQTVRLDRDTTAITLHLTAITSIASADLPHAVVGEGDARKVRWFPDRFPIGLHLAGRGVLVYVFSEPGLNDFRVFLERHAAVLRALPAWTLRLVAPPDLPSVGDRARRVVEQHLMSPLRPVTLDEMRWYLEHLRSAAPSDMPRFERARRAFASPHAQVLYKLWKQDGWAALVSIGSDAIRHAVETGRGRIEVLELGHRYGHLSPLAAVS